MVYYKINDTKEHRGTFELSNILKKKSYLR